MLSVSLAQAYKELEDKVDQYLERSATFQTVIERVIQEVDDP